MKFATEEQVVREASGTSILDDGASLKTPAELAGIVSRFASSGGWMDRVRLCAEGRWYERLFQDSSHDIWVISWLPGQSTGFHDHGESSGALVVATGILEEHRPAGPPLLIPPGQPRTFGPNYAHDVRNVSLAPAISIHAYSPPLDEMNEYELDGSRLIFRGRRSERSDTPDPEWQVRKREPASPISALGVEQILSAARARLWRLSPEEAHQAIAKTDAILVDIRPEGQRAIEGNIPGALIVERNVLEWRFDPASSARLPIATHRDLRIIVFCSEGYASSLAAVALQDLGFWRATDIVGGFHAWRAAGLPTA